MSLDTWIEGIEKRMVGAPHRHADPLALGAALDPPRRIRGRPIGVWRTAPLDLITRELVRLADGDLDRLMVFMPPQEGKSTTVSVWFPVWLLADDPTLRIAVVSYETGKAERWGKAVRIILEEYAHLGVRIRGDSRASARWQTTEGGGMLSVGIGGGITGEPVDVLIIDDPVKGRAEAESRTYRETAWDWWESNGSTRLSARGRVVLMMTRFHTDDLAGRLLVEEPGDWRVLSIPAIAENADDDPLGRSVGEEIPSVQERKPGHFHRLRKLRSPYVWQGVYQQRPTAAEGNLFKRDSWRYWQYADPAGAASPILSLGGTLVPLDQCWRFATVDLATSMRTSADFTVASAWAMTLGGDLVLLERMRARVAEADHWARIRPLVERFQLDTVFVEADQHGTTLVYEAGRAGTPISKLEADSDKLTRALPAATRQQQHRFWLPASAEWLDEWLDEHAEFPSSAHDDQVDTTAYAARVAAAHWSPVDALGGFTQVAPPTRPANEEPDVDFMSVPL